jgi:hypothetical protein
LDVGTVIFFACVSTVFWLDVGTVIFFLFFIWLVISSYSNQY